MTKINSINELENLACASCPTSEAYAQLAIDAARNLGGNCNTVSDSIRWLQTNAMETSEEGVVDEINFMIRPRRSRFT